MFAAVMLKKKKLLLDFRDGSTEESETGQRSFTEDPFHISHIIHRLHYSPNTKERRLKYVR